MLKKDVKSTSFSISFFQAYAIIFIGLKEMNRYASHGS